MIGQIRRRLRNSWLQRRLSGDARAVIRERLSYLIPAKFERLEHALGELDRKQIDGEFLEFGIALGGSAIVIAKAARRTGRRFAGFDVFEMIPPPESEKDDDKSRARFEKIKSGESKGIGGDLYYGYRNNLYDEVCASFARHGVAVDGEQVQLIKGLFEESWPSAELGPIAFAHIDCDWYDPVKFCLEAVGRHVSVGGQILLDDYHDYGGARAAVDEFLALHDNFVMRDGPNPILERVA